MFSFGTWTENFVLFPPKSSLNDSEKCLVPLQTNAFNEVISLGKISFPLSFGFWAGGFRQGCQKVVNVDGRTIEEIGCYFEWFDSWYCFLRLNKSFGILAEKFQQGCQYCNLRVEMNHLRRKIFFSNELSISIYFSTLWTKSSDFQRKKNRSLRFAFNVSGSKIGWKKVFCISYIFTHMFGLWPKNIQNFV